MESYPVFLNLKGRKAVVVGGGRVAERKVSGLLKAGAMVVVVSPRVTSRLKAHADRGRIQWRKRAYRKGDLREAFLSVAATDSARVNSKVSLEAPGLCNVIDSADLSNFIVPSSLRQGDLAIAVSTGGASPALARAIRLELETLYGPAFGRYLRKAREERNRLFQENAPERTRRRQLKRVGSRELLQKIREDSTL